MNSQEILEKFKIIQSNLIEYIDKEDNIEEHFQNLQNILDNQKIGENSEYLKQLLHLILNISNNHFRNAEFFQKIEKLLILFKEKITNHFSNHSIFNIFKSNKRILLFLIEQKFITIDKFIASILTSEKYEKAFYPQYFFPELQSFFNQESNQKYSLKIDQYFYVNRKTGENDSMISQLIRKDSIDQFITYVKQTNYPLNSQIKPSIFDTNSFFINKDKNLVFTEQNEMSLIEYAAFYGSIQIFKYLYKNTHKLSPSILTHSVHGDNPELIHFLEQTNKNSISIYLKEAISEAIKCHHNEIANYMINNLIKNKERKSLNENSIGLKYFNYQFMENNMINKSIFYELCKYDHYSFVEFLLKNGKIDVNEFRICYNKYYEYSLFSI